MDPVRNPFVAPSETGNRSDHAISGSLGSAVRTGQIITFALAQGLVVMAAILGFLGADGAPQGGQQAAADGLVLPGVGLLVTIGSCFAAALIPGIVRRAAIAKVQARGEKIELPVNSDATMTRPIQHLAGSSQTATLIGQAALEGAATVNLIFMLLSGNFLLHLALAGVGLVGIVLLTPTIGKLQRLIEDAARPH